MRIGPLSVLIAAVLIVAGTGTAGADVIRTLDGLRNAGPVVHLYTANASPPVFASGPRNMTPEGRHAGTADAGCIAARTGVSSSGGSLDVPYDLAGGFAGDGTGLPFGRSTPGDVFLPTAVAAVSAGEIAGITGVPLVADEDGPSWSQGAVFSPEPGSFALFGLALLVLGAAGRRFRRQRQA